MKKFLTSTIVVALVATMMGVFVACGDTNSNNDADTAQKAVTAVRQLYGDKAKETPIDYKLNSTQKVGDKLYNIKWSVSSSYANWADYIVVGTTKDDNGQITVGITQADDVIEYKLKASVTVGKATKSTEFERKVPAKAAGHAGTEADPYEVANVKEIGAALASGKYYEVDGAAKMIWVKGYVVDIGDYTKSNARVNNVYIVDEYAADKDKSSEGAQQVYSISYDDTVFTGQYPLNHGDFIVVKGFIQNYNGTLEITYKGNDSVYCTTLTPAEDTRTADQKLNAALNGAKLAANKYSATGNGIALPVSSVRGVTLSWAVKETNEYATVTDNKLNITKLPDSGTQTVVLVATATIDGTETKNTKEFNITVEKGEDLGLDHAGTEADPYSIADINKIFNKIGDSASYQVNGADKEVYVKGFITNGGEVGTYRLQNAYIADTAGATQAQSVLIYGLDWDEEKLPEGTTLSVGDEVVIKGYLKDYKGTDEIAQTGSGASATYPKLVSLTTVTDDRTAEQKVAAVKSALTLAESYTKGGDVKLPTSTVRGVTVTWASNNTNLIAISNNTKMTITMPETTTTVKVTATIKCGTEAEDTKEFDIELVKVQVLEAGTYKLVMNHTKFTPAKKLYFTGEMNGYYGGTTEDVLNAVDVVVTKVGDDYTLKAGTKYIEIEKSGTYINFKLLDEQTTGRWKFNANKGVLTWTADETEYFLGTDGTKTFTTISARALSGLDDDIVATFVVFNPSNEEKVALALGTVSDTLETIIATGKVDLPAVPASLTGVTFTWSLAEDNAATGVEITDNGTKLNVTAIPTAEDAIVKLVVTVTCGTGADAKTDTKNVTVTIQKHLVGKIEETFDFVSNFADGSEYGSGWDSSYTKREATIAQVGGKAITGKVEMSNANKQSSTITDRPTLCAKNSAQYVTVTVNAGSIVSVEFDLKEWADTKKFSDIHIEYTTNGTDWTTCSEVVTGRVGSTDSDSRKIASNATLPAGVTQIRLSFTAQTNSNTQMGLTSIKLKVDFGGEEEEDETETQTANSLEALPADED